MGAELYVAPGSRFERSKEDGSYEGASHATVLVRNAAGYRNLVKLVSRAYLEGYYYKPRVDHELLAQHADGLLVLSGCLNSEVSKLLAAGEEARARQVAGWYQDVFGRDHYFMEVQSHGLEAQTRVTAGTVRLARALGAPVCGTNDSHYLAADHARAHEALLCIQTGSTMDDPNRWRFSTEEFYLKSAPEMRDVFKDLPEAYRNTLAVAEQCDLELGFGAFHLPNYQVPAGFTLDSYLEHLAREGLRQRYGRAGSDAVEERLRYELSVISRMGFSAYFLVVWDFIAHARRQSIAVGPGRGSSAGSLVAYCLGITNVDPLRYGLIFERFLNPERISMPDMDIDFADDRRDEVIRYVVERYGADRVAHIITFGTMGAKAVIRDVGRVLGLSYAEADRIAKLVPAFPLNITLDESLERAPELAQLVKRDPRVGELWGVARTLEGCTRHASVHASAVVISDEPLIERIPLYKDPKRPELITGFAMGPIEKLGLLKMDFLGLKTLTVLTDAVGLVRESRGVAIDLDAIPLDDAPTYQLLSEARTAGVFQLESGGMREALQKLRPDRIEDIVAMVALYRPGPMEHIADFARRKHGQAEITYEHPAMAEELQETYGIIVYQEQVMRLAAAAGRVHPRRGRHPPQGHGQEGPRAHGPAARQVPGRLPRHPDRRAQGRADLGAGRQVRRLRVQQVACRVLRDRGVPDGVPEGERAGRLHGRAADLGDGSLGQARPVHRRVPGHGARGAASGHQRVARALHRGRRGHPLRPRRRQERGRRRHRGGGALAPGGGAVHLARRLLRPGRPSPDQPPGHREPDQGGGLRRVRRVPGPALLATLDQAMEAGQRAQRARAEGQGSLFDGLGGGAPVAAGTGPGAAATIPEWPAEQLLAYEKEALGFYLSGHPLERYRDVARLLGAASAADLAARPVGARLTLLGSLGGVREKATKSGNRMAFATLDVVDGSVPLTIFPEPLKACAPHLRHPGPVQVRGRVDETDKGRVLLVDEVVPADSPDGGAGRDHRVGARRRRLAPRPYLPHPDPLRGDRRGRPRARGGAGGVRRPPRPHAGVPPPPASGPGDRGQGRRGAGGRRRLPHRDDRGSARPRERAGRVCPTSLTSSGRSSSWRAASPSSGPPSPRPSERSRSAGSRSGCAACSSASTVT